MNVTQNITRSAIIHWQGDIAHGRGTITTESGKVEADYSFGTRFSGDPGTNPEELLAASHAACFTMALSSQLTRAGHPPASIDTNAFVHLNRVDAGFEITKIELATTVQATGISEDDFQKLATQAEETCPLSRALRSVPMSLKATLQST